MYCPTCGQDHHPDGGIASDTVDFAMQLSKRSAAQGITPVRAGQRQLDDARFQLGGAVTVQCVFPFRV